MPLTRVRHQVLWLTVVAYFITYIDRSMMSAAAPFIQQELHIGLDRWGVVLGMFYWSYSLFQLPGGWLGDTIGPRRALTLIVCWWSSFVAATALAWSFASLVVFRFLFGAGEAGAFPIATRSLSRWILPNERAWAQGVTHAGSRFGATITPVIVVWLALKFGWRAPFFIFAALGAAWAAVWFYWYRDTPSEHSWVNKAECDLIEKNLGTRSAKSKSVPWRSIFSSLSVWNLTAMYACYGWAFAIYLTWFPLYLQQARGVKLDAMGWYAAAPFAGAALGNMAGGWLSDRLSHRTGNFKTGRRSIAIFGFLLAAISIVPAALTSSAEVCVSLTCLALFGLEMTVSASWAVPLDIGSDYAGSVASVMNTAGNLGSAVSTTALGYIVKAAGWERPFLLAAALCVVAAALFSRIDASRPIEFPTTPSEPVSPVRTSTM